MEQDANARGLSGAIATASFCCTLAVANGLLHLTHLVSKALYLSIWEMPLSVSYNSCKKIDHVTFYYIFRQAIVLSETLGVEVKPSRQTTEGEGDHKNYFRNTLFEPFRYSMRDKLKTSFSSKPTILTLQELLPGFTKTLKTSLPVLKSTRSISKPLSQVPKI